MPSGNFVYREHVRMVLKYLDGIGVQSRHAEVTGRSHIRVRWTHNGREYQVCGAGTPKNHTHTGRNMIRDARRAMEGRLGRR